MKSVRCDGSAPVAVYSDSLIDGGHAVDDARGFPIPIAKCH